MNLHNFNTFRWTKAIRRLPIHFLTGLGLLALWPMLGCTIGDGELFVQDVKHFYLNGGFTNSMEGDVDMLSGYEFDEGEDLFLSEPVVLSDADVRVLDEQDALDPVMGRQALEDDWAEADLDPLEGEEDLSEAEEDLLDAEEDLLEADEDLLEADEDDVLWLFEDDFELIELESGEEDER